MAQEMTRFAVESSSLAVDAASIVFAHTILDDMALECSKVIASVDSQVERLVQERKASLQEWRDRGYAVVRREMLEKYLEELGDKSLLEKVDFIFAHCRPPAGWSKMEGYEFDRDRLSKFDTLRHEVVHGDAWATSVPKMDDELFFLFQTGVHFIALINYRYGLKMAWGK